MLCENHVYPTLPASDMERARRFYEGVLGFEPALVTSAGVLYDARGTRIFLYPSQFAGSNRATACAFEVEDLAAMQAQLSKKGVRFEEYDSPQMRTENGILHTPDGDMSWFTDTEGNLVGVFQTNRNDAWPRDEVRSAAGA